MSIRWNVERQRMGDKRKSAQIALYKGVRLRMTHDSRCDVYVITCGKHSVAQRYKRDAVAAIKAYVNANY